MKIWYTKVFPFVLCRENSFFFFPANRLNNTAQCKPRSWVSRTDVSLTDRWFLSSPYSWFAHVQKRWTKHLRTLCVFSSFRGWRCRRHRGSWPAGPLTGLPLQSEWGLSHPSVSSLGAALWAYWSSVLSHQQPRVALPFSLSLPSHSVGSRWAETAPGWDLVNALLDECPLRCVEGEGSRRVARHSPLTLSAQMQQPLRWGLTQLLR